MESSGDLNKLQVLIQQVWGRTRGYAFLTTSQVVPLLLTHRTHSDIARVWTSGLNLDFTLAFNNVDA